jgi:hypothetical protein
MQSDQPFDEQEAFRQQIAEQLSISPSRLSNALLGRIARDPLFLHHLIICKNNPELVELLFHEAETFQSPSRSKLTNRQLLKRASVAVSHWAATGFRRVSEEEYQRRLSVCASCDHQINAPKDKFLYKLLSTASEHPKICNLCGCMLTKKARLVSEKCPDNSFGPGGRW